MRHPSRSFVFPDPDPKKLRIALLADHVEEVPTLARWFRSEWPDHYAGRDPAEPEREFLTQLHRDRLPIRLIAFEGAELVGTIVLRERALDPFPEYRPGLGGLYVVGSHRGRSTGTVLVRAGMGHGRVLGYETLYTATAAAGGILTRLGWDQMHSVQHGGEEVTFYRCTLDGDADHVHFAKVAGEGPRADARAVR